MLQVTPNVCRALTCLHYAAIAAKTALNHIERHSPAEKDTLDHGDSISILRENVAIAAFVAAAVGDETDYPKMPKYRKLETRPWLGRFTRRGTWQRAICREAPGKETAFILFGWASVHMLNEINDAVDRGQEVADTPLAGLYWSITNCRAALESTMVGGPKVEGLADAFSAIGIDIEGKIVEEDAVAGAV